jgi:hypothetical protein
MAEEGHLMNIVMAFGLFIVFGLSILYSVQSLGDRYDINTGEITEPLGIENFTQIVEEYNETSTNVSDEMMKDKTTFVGEAVALTGIWGTLKKITELVRLPFNLITKILALVGIPTWVSGLILALMTIGILFALWRLIKIGS